MSPAALARRRGPTAPPVAPLVGLLGPVPFPPGVEEALAELFGPVHRRSPLWPFTATRYYEPEMGSPLARRFLLFGPRRGALAAWKRATDALEHRWERDGARRVNLDPGYVSPGALVLASRKPGPQRIPIDETGFAEVTLWFQAGRWVSLPWTFPDFRSGRYDAFLSAARELLRPGPPRRPALERRDPERGRPRS